MRPDRLRILHPESVGRIGEVDITSGNYLLAQYDAYQQAADLAQEDQDPTKVSAFLRQQITPEGGEPVTVADFVAEKTQQNLDRYAAIETRFAQLGGELTELEQAQAEAYGPAADGPVRPCVRGQRHRPCHPGAV